MKKFACNLPKHFVMEILYEIIVDSYKVVNLVMVCFLAPEWALKWRNLKRSVIFGLALLSTAGLLLVLLLLAFATGQILSKNFVRASMLLILCGVDASSSSDSNPSCWIESPDYFSIWIWFLKSITLYLFSIFIGQRSQNDAA